MFISSSTDNNKGDTSPSLLDSVVDCEESDLCKQQCNKLFSIDVLLLNKCLDQKSNIVSKMNSVFPPMQKGNWKSIKADSLKALIDFDDDIWPKYAGVNTTQSREMLLWVAKNKDIARLLDDDHKILGNAFRVLGFASYDKKVQEGMNKDVDLDNQHTFFEVSVHSENDSAFKAAHELLRKECGENNKPCVKKVYCNIGRDLVFGKLNNLDLGEDADPDGTLNRVDCP